MGYLWPTLHDYLANDQLSLSPNWPGLMKRLDHPQTSRSTVGYIIHDAIQHKYLLAGAPKAEPGPVCPTQQTPLLVNQDPAETGTSIFRPGASSTDPLGLNESRFEPPPTPTEDEPSAATPYPKKAKKIKSHQGGNGKRAKPAAIGPSRPERWATARIINQSDPGFAPRINYAAANPRIKVGPAGQYRIPDLPVARQRFTMEEALMGESLVLKQQQQALNQQILRQQQTLQELQERQAMTAASSIPPLLQMPLAMLQAWAGAGSNAMTSPSLLQRRVPQTNDTSSTSMDTDMSS